MKDKECAYRIARIKRWNKQIYYINLRSCSLSAEKDRIAIELREAKIEEEQVKLDFRVGYLAFKDRYPVGLFTQDTATDEKAYKDFLKVEDFLRNNPVHFHIPDVLWNIDEDNNLLSSDEDFDHLEDIFEVLKTSGTSTGLEMYESLIKALMTEETFSKLSMDMFAITKDEMLELVKQEEEVECD